MAEIKLQGPAIGADLGTVTVTGDGRTGSVEIPAFGGAANSAASVLPLISGPQADGDTATVDTSRLTNVTAIQWRVTGGANLGTTATQDLTGLGGSRVEVQTVSDEGTLVSPSLLVHTLMMHASHNVADAALVALATHDTADRVASQSGDWSNPSTWVGGVVPANGESVLIPHGRDVSYDVDAPDVLIPQLRVDGDFRFATDTSSHLYVRDFVGDRASSINIGNSLNDRVQSDVQVAVTFEGQTPLDLVTDPELLGRGLVTIGALNIFGSEMLNHSRAAFPEEAGSRSVVLEELPVGWKPGMKIIVGATDTILPWLADTGMVDVSQDETVTITRVVGNVVHFLPALVHNHNCQNTRADRQDVRPMVQLKAESRNIIIKSEVLAPVTQRGHIMVMHMHSRTDVWDVGLIELGRTDKSRPVGGRVANDMFEYYDADVGQFGAKVQVPMTADANIRGRYSFHTHIVGYDHEGAGRPMPTAVNVTIDGNPGWGFTQHDCEMNVRTSSVIRAYGCGFVGEQGGELGEWHDLSVMQATAVNRTAGFLSSTAKGHHGNLGVAGDFFRDGYAFGYRGRAITVTKCVATTCVVGHVFWHRGGGDELFETSNPPRDRMDLKEAGLFNSDPDLRSPDLWKNEHYPIIHFTDCGANACLFGTFISKQTPAQGHDYNVLWKGFFAHGCRIRGVDIEYIATYILQDIDIVMSEEGFSHSLGQQGLNVGNNCYQIALVRPRVEGCLFAGVVISGVVAPPLADSGKTAESFDAATEPRFWIIGYDSIGNGTRLNYTNGGNKTFDQIGIDVPDLAGDYINYSLSPTETYPDVVATWDGTNFGIITSRPSNALGMKVGSTPMNLPLADKVWEDTFFPGRVPTQDEIDNNVTPTDGALKIVATVNNEGYSQYNGNDVLVQREIISDVLSGRPSKFTCLWQADTAINFGVDNGPIALSTPVTAPDELLVVAPGGSVTFNALAGASGGSGTYEIDPGDYTEPDYGKLDIDYATGMVTYTARPGVKDQSDFGYVLIRSVRDTGAVKTETRAYGSKRIAFLITDDATMQAMVHRTNYHFAEVSGSNSFDVKLVKRPFSGGRRILSVQYSTDAGATWRRLCQNYPLTTIRVDVGSDGNAITSQANVRLRYQTDHEHGFSPETPDVAAVGGDPVTLIFGQSNAGYLDGSNAMFMALGEYGVAVTELTSTAGGAAATTDNGPWNIVDGTGPQAGEAYTNLTTAVSNYLAANPDAYIASAVWVHGETDAGQIPQRVNYETNVTAIFNGIREVVGYDFPISATGITDTQSIASGAVANINTSMQALAANVSGVYYVDLEAIITRNGFVAGDVLLDALHWNNFFLEFVAEEVIAEQNIRVRYGIAT